MTAKRRLVPEREVKSVLDLLKAYGIDPKTVVIDIRADGVTFSPPAEKPGNAYDSWKAKDKSRDRPPHRH
jgi:hypothetical protein